MKPLNLDHHISQRFNAELENVRNRVMAMGGLVEQQLAQVLRALPACDAEAAEKIVFKDYQVNAMEVDIDEECTAILALRQPTASDLRLIVAVAKTIADLERAGDEVKRIARLAMHLDKGKCRPEFFLELEPLGDRVRDMLHNCLDAFARMDVDTALGVAREDRKADREYEAIIRQMMTCMTKDPRCIPVTLNIMWCARALEQIGDRSCNICEYVIYFVKGKDVRHTSLEEMEKEALDKD